MTYNLIFIHNIMAKTTKFNFKKVNYHNLLGKKDRKHMILFLLGLIVLCALFYFFMKREGYGCNKKEGMKPKKENYQDKEREPLEDDKEREPLEEDEEEEEEEVDEIFNCEQLKNKTMDELSGYTFEQLKECVLE
jgi:CRISPR/Cas system CSM-associated protein Csm3 (group 7 of RAMP superfamily)